METSSVLSGCSNIFSNSTWDWSQCIRTQILNSFLPIFSILLSLSILFFHFTFSWSSKKKKFMALKVAKLDPSASTFQIQPDESTTSTTSTPPSPSPIARFISKLLPWNSIRIIGSQTSNSAFNIAAQSQPQSTTSATTSTNLASLPKQYVKLKMQSSYMKSFQLLYNHNLQKRREGLGIWKF